MGLQSIKMFTIISTIIFGIFAFSWKDDSRIDICIKLVLSMMTIWGICVWFTS